MIHGTINIKDLRYIAQEILFDRRCYLSEFYRINRWISLTDVHSVSVSFIGDCNHIPKQPNVHRHIQGLSTLVAVTNQTPCTFVQMECIEARGASCSCDSSRLATRWWILLSPCQYQASNAALLFVCRPGANEGLIRSTNSHPYSKHAVCTVMAVGRKSVALPAVSCVTMAVSRCEQRPMDVTCCWRVWANRD